MICIHYDWYSSLLPANCVCGNSFTAEHALSCTFGDLSTKIHKQKTQVLTAKPLKNISSNVTIKTSTLQLCQANIMKSVS